MKLLRLACIVVIAQFAARAALAGPCVTPPPFGQNIPDGANASREDMQAAQRAIKAYDNVVIAYAVCLRDSGLNIHQADVADEALRDAAARFNDQLKAFKERTASSKQS